jgi:hypothetical protein
LGTGWAGSPDFVRLVEHFGLGLSPRSFFFEQGPQPSILNNAPAPTHLKRDKISTFATKRLLLLKLENQKL